MRKLATTPTSTSTSLFRWKTIFLGTHRLLVGSPALHRNVPTRHLAQVRPESLSELWFTAATPRRSPADELLNNNTTPGPGKKDHKPPDERTLKLGETLRTLSPLLPNILSTPIPQSILAPSISLHLFPSTHPHLPAVKGRVPYRAALWTAPVAWGCVPLISSVRLEIISEKIVRTGFQGTPLVTEGEGISEEKLVVRWRTEKKNNGSTPATNASSATAQSTANQNGRSINRGLSTLLGGDKPIFTLSQGDEFTGIFVFTFDSKGRIATHTIEHADENNGFDKTSKVVTLTDWLLGKARLGATRNKEEELIPGLAMRVCREEWRSASNAEQARRRRIEDRLW